MVRRLKQRAEHKVLARNVRSGSEGPARGVGCSEAARRLAEDEGFQLRQHAVENIEYLLAD